MILADRFNPLTTTPTETPTATPTATLTIFYTPPTATQSLQLLFDDTLTPKVSIIKEVKVGIVFLFLLAFVILAIKKFLNKKNTKT